VFGGGLHVLPEVAERLAPLLEGDEFVGLVLCQEPFVAQGSEEGTVLLGDHEAALRFICHEPDHARDSLPHLVAGHDLVGQELVGFLGGGVDVEVVQEHEVPAQVLILDGIDILVDGGAAWAFIAHVPHDLVGHVVVHSGAGEEVVVVVLVAVVLVGVRVVVAVVVAGSVADAPGSTASEAEDYGQGDDGCGCLLHGELSPFHG